METASIETELHPQTATTSTAKSARPWANSSPPPKWRALQHGQAISSRLKTKKIGTFIVRGQAGYVYAREGEEVPSSLMFRTGGATSVRGYELDSIGLAGPKRLRPAATRLGGRQPRISISGYQKLLRRHLP